MTRARTHAQCPGVICFETAKELKFPSLDVARPKAVYDQSHRVSTNHLSHFLFRCQIEARPLVHERPGTQLRHALPAGVSNGPDNKYVLDHLFFYSFLAYLGLSAAPLRLQLQPRRRVTQALHCSHVRSNKITCGAHTMKNFRSWKKIYIRVRCRVV